MPNKPHLTIVGGTTAPDETVITVSTGSDGGWVGTGVVDADGNQYWKTIGPTPPSNGGQGGGGNLTPLWRLDIPRDVQIVKWGMAALLSAFALAFWFLLGQIDGRFDRADEKISHVSDQVGDMRVYIAGQNSDIKAILEKVNAPKSTHPSQPGPVK